MEYPILYPHIHAVVDCREDATTFSRQRPIVLRGLGHDLDLNPVTASLVALS